jgi:hypothetical protein
MLSTHECQYVRLHAVCRRCRWRVPPEFGAMNPLERWELIHAAELVERRWLQWIDRLPRDLEGAWRQAQRVAYVPAGSLIDDVAPVEGVMPRARIRRAASVDRRPLIIQALTRRNGLAVSELLAAIGLTRNSQSTLDRELQRLPAMGYRATKRGLLPRDRRVYLEQLVAIGA